MAMVDLVQLALLGIPAISVGLYPAAMALRSTLLHKQRLAPPPVKVPPPPITVVISAYNEEDSIRDRIKNVLAMDYPNGRLQIVVVSDGSTDRTAEMARSYSDFGVRVLEFAANIGKSAALAEVAKHIDTSLSVYTDANSRYDCDALLRLVRWFQYPEVGAVCGRLVYDQSGASNIEAEEDRYWRWDNWIKHAESHTGHMVAGNGSILAIRTRLAEAIPAYLANDFAWLNIARLRGYRVCFDPTAIAREQTAPTMAGEFRRRVRIMTRGLNAVAHAFRYHASIPLEERPTPRATGLFFTQLICKKLFRYLAFPAVLLAMCLTPLLTTAPSLALGVGLWAAMAGLTLVGLLRPRMLARFPQWPNTLYPLVMASASLVALYRFSKGQRVSTWTPERPAIASGEVPKLADQTKAVA
jgi:cellulose synthase/poly-beta-1,6-N-acetylglucosamine synthase-like glycosyltransferase